MGKRSRTKREKSATPAAVRSSPASHHSRLAWSLAAAIALATLIVYAQVRTHHYLTVDDPDYVTQNPHVASGLTADSIRWAFTSTHAANWHPLTWISLMTDAQLFGVDAGKSLLVNVVLHIVAAVVLLFALRRATGSTGRSAAVAALFALHPLHVESVAWVAERKDVLGALFFMLAILAHVSGRRWLTAGAFLLGILSKPTVISLPFVLLLLDWWPLRRSNIKSLVIEKWPLFALMPLSAVTTLHAQKPAYGEVTLPFRVGNAVIAYAVYLRKAVVPTALSVLYPFPHSIAPLPLIASAIVLIAITIAAFRWRDRHPYVAVGWLWYVITLGPMSGIVKVGHQAMADRYTYIPLVGIAIAVCWLAADLIPVRAALIALATAATIVFACIAYVQIGHWRDSTTLYRHAIAVDPENGVAHTWLGNTLAMAGDADGARKEFNAAIAADSRNIEPFRNLARIEMTAGHPERAIPTLRTALREKPDDLGLIAELAAAEGDLDRGIDAYHRLIESDPDIGAYHSDLGTLLMRKGDNANALEQYRIALRIAPDDYEAQMNTGALLARMGRDSEALDSLDAAAKSRPRSCEPHIYRALIYGNTNRFADAAREVRAAEAIDPVLANTQFTNAVHIAPDPSNLTHYREALEQKAAGRG